MSPESDIIPPFIRARKDTVKPVKKEEEDEDSEEDEDWEEVEGDKGMKASFDCTMFVDHICVDECSLFCKPMMALVLALCVSLSDIVVCPQSCLSP